MSKRGLQTQMNSTMMVQEIVAVLKNPPFNEAMTLLSFEEKREYELLDMILRVMIMIDKSLSSIDKDNTTEVLKNLFDFLRIINFPHSSDSQLQNDIAKGEKRFLIQILHFLLTKLSELKKEYYLNKFTSKVKISDEYAADEEIAQLSTNYQELQTEFKQTYAMLEEKRANVPQIKELKEEIQKNQNEKLELTSSIQKFKKQYANKADFQQLLEITSKLRKEQEKDSDLEKKIARQQYEIKETEERLLVAQQRLLENEKNIKNNVSATQLLQNKINQRNMNRTNYENLEKCEYVDIQNKLKSISEILRMPEVTFDDIANLKQTRENLIADINKLEDKIKKSPIKSPDLQIYRQNAIKASADKEMSEKIFAKTENEKNLMELRFKEMSQKFEATKGYKFVRTDDLLQQAENLKKKKTTYQKCQKAIDQIKGEALIIDRTINILKGKTPDGEEILKQYEEKNGKIINQAKRELEQLATRKQEIDESKALTLEEYSKLIQELTVKLKDSSKKSILAPLAEERDSLKKEYDNILPTYNNKKSAFQKATAELQKKYDAIYEEYSKDEKLFRECQDKYHQLNLQMKINEDMLKRCEQEYQFMTKPDKRYKSEHKTYQDYYHALISAEDNVLQELREKQQKTRDIVEDNERQVKFYTDLKEILKIKLQSVKSKK